MSGAARLLWVVVLRPLLITLALFLVAACLIEGAALRPFVYAEF